MNDRGKAMVKAVEDGLTYAEIGCRWGISRERVRQIVKGNPKPKKPKFEDVVLLTTGDVARLLNCHTNTVRRWTNKGFLEAYRITPRRDRRFQREDIDRFLKGNII